LPPGRKQKSAKKIGLRDSAAVCAPRSGGRAEGAGIPLIETSSYRTKTMRVESQNPETEQSAEERRCLMCGQAFHGADFIGNDLERRIAEMKVKRKQRSRAYGKGLSASQIGRGHKGPGKNGGRAQNGAKPAQSVERYLALARKAQAAGDAVQSQYYYQHAEHYLRKTQKQG
jgi:ribosomal protein L34E